MFQYCTNVYGALGADKNCIVQCHPKVDCGVQAARNCQPFKDEYEQFEICTDRERKFCGRFGEFGWEKYPNFKAKHKKPKEKAEEIVIYCGNLFQWRGMKLPCLRACTLYEMRVTKPERYFAWRAKVRMRRYRGMKDPTEPQNSDHEIATFTECEKQAFGLCRFLRADFWRECFERQKLKCLRSAGKWNDMLADWG